MSNNDGIFDRAPPEKEREVNGFLISYKPMGEVDTIPVPPQPDYRDNEESNYIRKPLTDEEKEVLRKAATHFTNLLSSPDPVLSLLRAPFQIREASANMRHYIVGNGELRNYSEDQTERLIDNGVAYNRDYENSTVVTKPKDIQEVFLDLIKKDFRGKDKQGYLSLNLNRTIYVNWFSVQSKEDDWYYAIGSFLVSYGAYLKRLSGKKVILKYRSYIYDRYNWNTIGSIHLPVLSDEAILSNLTKEEREIFDRANKKEWQIRDSSMKANSVEINDSFIGLLTDLGTTDGHKPKAYDIVGGGKILGYEYEE
ncbi:hypothetical protein [Bartonella sp. HY761]|uniref:hypothetical protein n=1 Tax=Bartonella sp. HY761 TaxID=2979330 RepID=UPI00220AEF32|nr:hypothetical protein [Bartonella sp. HY761]UXN05927.1 hypothetical protein N6A79_11605 [Bartonella sp. HY761]